MPGVLSGIKVIDLGTMIAGPGAATVLSDQGAEVIKVETPGIGDVMRYLGANRGGISGLYHNINRGKRSLAVDLKNPEGVALVKDLSAGVDVVLQNFRPGVAERLGVDYESIKAVNPGIVYLSVCGFGDRGPLAGKAAYDNVIQAFAGVAQSQADQETGEPIQYYQLFSDKLTALTGSQAIVAALLARERGQGGQHIKLSMADSVVSFLWADAASVAAFAGEGAQQGLSVAKGVRLIRFKDGWGAAAPVTDPQFHGYFKAFGVDSSSPEVATVGDRNANPQALVGLIKQAADTAAKMYAADAIAALEAEDVPCSQALQLADLPQHPQMIANNSFTKIENPAAGTMIEPNNPANFLGSPSPSVQPAAALGQHTHEILSALGRSDADIKSLREAGVIA